MCYEANLDDLNFSGNLYTWSNKSEGTRRICCKLNRVLIYDIWLNSFPHSFVVFGVPFIFNHCPSIVSFGEQERQWRIPFSIFNMCANHDSFLPLVDRIWKMDYEGSPVFKLVTKLKTLKVKFKALNRKEFWNISKRAKKARDDFLGSRMRTFC